MSPGDIAAIVTALVAVVALVGGYVQFVLRRSGLGFVEFDVEFANHYRGTTHSIGEIVCVIKNVGSNMVIVTNVQCRAKYRLVPDSEDATHGVEPALKHVIVPPANEVGTMGHDWFAVLADRTFIQPGVTERYRKPVLLPADAQVLHVWASFDYRIKTKGLTRALIGLTAELPEDMDWRDGIRAHTTRRSFSVAATDEAQKSEKQAP